MPDGKLSVRRRTVSFSGVSLLSYLVNLINYNSFVNPIQAYVEKCFDYKLWWTRHSKVMKESLDRPVWIVLCTINYKWMHQWNILCSYEYWAPLINQEIKSFIWGTNKQCFRHPSLTNSQFVVVIIVWCMIYHLCVAIERIWLDLTWLKEFECPTENFICISITPALCKCGETSHLESYQSPEYILNWKKMTCYLSEWWTGPLSPHGVTRPQCINNMLNENASHHDW